LFAPAGEDRPRLAFEEAEEWAADPSDESRAAAETAAWAAGAAAETAAWAAGAAARAAAETAAHRKMCQIIRSMLVCPFEEVCHADSPRA
ncbi:MAG: hypothetical protein ABIJ96_01820, partial [Elusimicrobiota bacterium]